MKKIYIAALLCLPVLTNAKTTDVVATATPIYSQTLHVKMPAHFNAAFKDQKGGSFLMEFVPQGQSTEKWSEMITFSGAQDAVQQNLSTDVFMKSMAQGFNSACPTTFNLKVVNESANQLAAVLSCGNTGVQSEETLIVAMQGARDLYTVQWAQRGAASQTPLKIDEAMWLARLKLLAPSLSSK